MIIITIRCWNGVNYAQHVQLSIRCVGVDVRDMKPLTSVEDHHNNPIISVFAIQQQVQSGTRANREFRSMDRHDGNDEIKFCGSSKLPGMALVAASEIVYP